MMKKGKRQVTSVQPSGASANQNLVIGLALATYGDDQNSIGVIHDPPSPKAIPVDVPPDDIVRWSYAKVFASFGMPVHAQFLLENRNIGHLHDQLELVTTKKVGQQEFIVPKVPNWPDDIRGLWNLGLLKAVYDTLLKPPKDLESSIETALDGIKPTEDEHSILLNNGVLLQMFK